MVGADEVGKRFESGDFFLPELMLAGRALKAAMEVLNPILAWKNLPSRGQGSGQGRHCHGPDRYPRYRQEHRRLHADRRRLHGN